MPILKPSPVGMGTGDSWRKKKILIAVECFNRWANGQFLVLKHCIDVLYSFSYQLKSNSPLTP